MAKSGKKYGYTMALWELGQTVPSMFRKVSDYKRAQGIPSTNLWNAMVDPSWAPLPIRPLMSLLASRDAQGDAWNLCHFWSNFEIADLDWFRSLDYRKFFDFLDRDGGFYDERASCPLPSFYNVLILCSGATHQFIRSLRLYFSGQRSCTTSKISAMFMHLFNRARQMRLVASFPAL